MTESYGVVAMWGPSARSGPSRLDRVAAWTTWHGVNMGRVRESIGHRARDTVRRARGVGKRSRAHTILAQLMVGWLVCVMDPFVHHPK
jgi:hypothetical protein